MVASSPVASPVGRGASWRWRMAKINAAAEEPRKQPTLPDPVSHSPAKGLWGAAAAYGKHRGNREHTRRRHHRLFGLWSNGEFADRKKPRLLVRVFDDAL